LDPISLSHIFTLGAALQIGGPILAVMLIWWVDRRDISKILRQNQEQLNSYRDDTNRILKQLEDYLRTAVQMYNDNVELVKNYQKVAGDFREVVVSNSTICANLNNAIHNTIQHNLFCPLVREKTGG
jgi:ABC-type transporter Mla subunit MlaD